MQPNKKNRKHIWGLWMALGAGVLCLSPYLVVFAFPVVLLGIGFIWASALEVGSKLLLSLLPLVLILIAGLLVANAY